MATNVFDAIVAAAEALTTLNKDAAKEAEGPVLRAMQATARAGTTPSGEPWPEKQSGGRALSGAADALTSEVKGTRIEIRLGAGKERYVFHNYGAGGSSKTKEAKRARAGAKRDRAAREASGEKVAKSKFASPARQIIPMVDDPVPPKVAAEVKAAIERTFARAMGGR